jgi:hypothetical protein
LDLRHGEAGAGSLMALKGKRSAAYAVLTGDLVKSTSLTPAMLTDARDVVTDATAEIARWSEGSVAARVEFFRGDAWQFALGDARFFLRAAVYVRARLRAANSNFDTRIGIGLGKVEHIDPVRTSLSSGEAFVISGRTLDAIGGASGLAVGLADRFERRLAWIDPMAGLCSALVDHWTERQAELVGRMLVPERVSQLDLATSFQITKQTVSKALAAADYSALLAAIEHAEQIDWVAEMRRRTVEFI